MNASGTRRRLVPEVPFGFVLQMELFEESVHGVLGEDGAGVADAVDDGAAARLQVRDRQFAEAEDAPQVDVQHGVPVVEAGLLPVGAGDDAGGVDHRLAVDLALARDHAPAAPGPRGPTRSRRRSWCCGICTIAMSWSSLTLWSWLGSWIRIGRSGEIR